MPSLDTASQCEAGQTALQKVWLAETELCVQEAALKSRWLPIDHEDATRMIHLLDRDRNGMVSYEEFRSFAYLLPESQVSSPEIVHHDCKEIAIIILMLPPWLCCIGHLSCLAIF